MHIPRFYISQSIEENSTLELEPSTAHHIATVLRMKAGRQVTIFNGKTYRNKTGEFEATLAYVDKKNVCVAIGNFIEQKTESSLQVELGVCLIKNDRMDWLLQKAVELGVASIAPLWSEYTDVKIPQDRLEKKQQHWQKILISAVEQCGRTQVPTFTPPQKCSDWVANVKADKKIILHPYKNSPKDTGDNPAKIALLVGPEGGFSENEVLNALDYGFEARVLGPRILRAETAPLAALSLLQYQFGDIS